MESVEATLVGDESDVSDAESGFGEAEDLEKSK
jgi:hypothetical protein